VTPEAIEKFRKEIVGIDELCELALDGLRFRVWCEGASDMTSGVGVGRLAVLLCECQTPQDYRAAIDRFIVERARR
jgi:hypothetical protein